MTTRDPGFIQARVQSRPLEDQAGSHYILANIFLNYHRTSNTSKANNQYQADLISRQYPQQRPISTQSLEQYAYIPQESSTFHPPHLSHIQSAPRFFHRTDKPQNDAAEQNQKLIHSSNQFSVPPPSSSRFKPATNSSVPFTSNPARSLPAAQKPKMGPPPTPQHPHNDGPTQSNNGGNGQGPSHRKAYNRALPPPSRRQTAVPATPILGQHPSGASPRRFFQTGQSSSMPFVSSSRGASRPSIANLSTGGQRTPFIPHVGQQGGFF
ncbi:hypothetical protein BDZ97DRAFT_1754257 [Flammula alnicola]|nr:hypothetical protein BDZ97DRAFT_1754257 [Flammula alnicola]